LNKRRAHRRAFYGQIHAQEHMLSYEEMLQKCREVEQYMLSLPDQMISIIEDCDPGEAVGNVLKIFSLYLHAAIKFGSIEEWKKENGALVLSSYQLAEKAAEVLILPDFEFSAGWPWTKTEMLEICQQAFEVQERERNV
jgi:hypothetical protein